MLRRSTTSSQTPGRWHRFVDEAVGLIFPRFCCGCDERVVEPCRLVCAPCDAALEPIPRPVCRLCGAGNARFSEADRCDHCPDGEVHFEAARACHMFSGTAERVVKKLKYDRREEYADYLGLHMAGAIKRTYGDRVFGVVVPVPLHKSRQRERGFNQSELLARVVSQRIGVPFSSSLIIRSRATPTQTRLSKDERIANVAGAFAVLEARCTAGCAVLLVDDVYTTGATLNECARTLRAAGAASVHCMTFARAV